MSKDLIRFDRLQQVSTKALTESQKVITDENLSTCYPTIASTPTGKALLTTIKTQLIESWTQNAIREFEAIFEEREAHEKLDQLDELIAEAQEKKKNGIVDNVPFDTLSPANIVSSHLIGAKEANLKYLHEQCESLKKGNEELLADLQDMLKTAEGLRDDVVNSLEGVNSLVKVSDEAQLETKLKELADALAGEKVT